MLREKSRVVPSIHLMKALVAALTCALFMLPSAFGQKSKVAKLLSEDPRFAFSPDAFAVKPRVVPVFAERFSFEIPHSVLRGLEDRYAARRDTRDRITVGLMAIADNIGASDFTSDGLSWRDGDRALRFRSLSKFTYRYNPRRFSGDPLVVLDRAFAHPVRLFLTNTLSF